MGTLNLGPIVRDGSIRSRWDEGACDNVDAAAISPIPTLPGNVIEWFETPGYLFPEDVLARQRRNGLYLFPQAFVTLRDFFDLICPYCQDAQVIADTPVDQQDLPSQILLRDGACPQCGVTMLDVVKAKRAAGLLECVICLGMGAGKRQSVDTPIPTPSGWTTMGGLRDGDTIFDDQGKPCTVLKTHPVETHTDAYRVVFRGGYSVLADAEHLWMTLDHNARKNIARNTKAGNPGKSWNAAAKIRTTKEIAETIYPKAGPRGGWNHHIPMADPLVLPEIDLPIHPYVLGAWLGNGTSSAASIAMPYPEVGEQIRACGENAKPPKSSRPDKCPAWSLGGDHPRGRLTRRLRALGVFRNKHIPADYLRASAEQRLHLLQGLMDTDGTCSSDGKCEFTTCSLGIAERFDELCLSLKIRTVNKEGRATLYGRDMGPKWRFTFTTDVEVFRLPRKRDRWLGRPPGMSTENWAIVSAEPVPSVPMRCITVDSPSGLYLCGKGMIPTHNTSLFGGVAAYVAALCARTPKIREALDFAPGAPMQIAFCASTATQTRATIWAYFVELVRQSPWWIRARESVRIASPDGKGDLFDDNTTAWNFEQQGFECRSLNSNSSGLAGLRRLVVLLDELARFDVEGKRGAEEMYQVMYGSMKNTWKAYELILDRGELPPFKPFMAAFSSPIHEGDKIMSLGADALRDPETTIYFKRLPTWEWNPNFTKADFARELARNPRRAKRDFGAEPQGYHERLIENGDLVDRCCDPRRRSLITTRDVFFTDPTGVRCLKPELAHCPRDKVTKRFMHCDPGHVGDSFGIAIGQMAYERDSGMPRVMMDAILEVRPYIAKFADGEVRHEVDFIGVTDMLLEICRRLNIVKGSFDHWNSIMSVQKIRMQGVPMERVNVTTPDWEAVADAVTMGYLSLPAPERVGPYDAHDRKSPVLKAVYEVKSMERPTPEKVDHPKDGSSDLAVCIAGVIRHMLIEGGIGTLARTGRDGAQRQGPAGWLSMQASRSLPAARRIGAVVRFRRL